MARAAVNSPWRPLHWPIFRAVWTATLVSNLGSTMQNAGAAWLMASLAVSPIIVTLVQTAGTLPVLLLGLPAGAIADIVDRRRLLLLTQVLMLMAALALGITSWVGLMSPLILLTLTFVMGVGAAMNGPAWQAVVAEIVPSEDLAGAVSLNSAGFNIARAVGPALAGLVLARAGAGVVFLLNALSFVGVLVVLYRWHSTRPRGVLPAERVGGALRAGFRYLAHAPELRVVVLRTVLFAFPASALWGLLPLVASKGIGGTPLTYGLLLGGLGVGALGGAWILPALKGKVGLETLVTGGTAGFALATLGSATLHHVGLLFLVCVIGGAGWLILLASLNAATRMRVPQWVEARALAFYLLAFQGSLAAGSAAWGAIATVAGLRVALQLSAGTLIAGIAARFALPLGDTEVRDLHPAKAWPEPEKASPIAEEEGPIRVTVEYSVPLRRAWEFREHMRQLRTLRRRDGAFRWALFVDSAAPTRFIEEFMVESWLEHLRQHERLTIADIPVQTALRELLTNGTNPVVSHHFAVDLGHPKQASPE